MTPQDRAIAGFAATFGVAPDGVCFAPGRVNLIGDHVDYNDGLVLPMPISTGTAVAWQAIGTGVVEAVALDMDQQHDVIDLAVGPAKVDAGWRAYLRGMIAAMPGRGLPVAGVRLAITGDIQRGSGLSSSASFCVATGRAVAAAAGLVDPDAQALALAAQQAEHDWAGVNCGIMDQLAVAAGRAGTPLLLDCQNLAVRHIALPRDWAVVIVQSGVQRGLVDGEYNARRADCMAAAQQLNLPSLRLANVNTAGFAELPFPIAARARHVVTEIQRVRAAVTALENEDLAAFGALMNASHQSLRDDFAVSHPAVDQLVAALQAAIGSHGGARMTGGGFGGAVVAVTHRAAVAQLRASAIAHLATITSAAADIIVETTGANGAGDGND